MASEKAALEAYKKSLGAALELNAKTKRAIGGAKKKNAEIQGKAAELPVPKAAEQKREREIILPMPEGFEVAEEEKAEGAPIAEADQGDSSEIKAEAEVEPEHLPEVYYIKLLHKSLTSQASLSVETTEAIRQTTTQWIATNELVQKSPLKKQVASTSNMLSILSKKSLNPLPPSPLDSGKLEQLLKDATTENLRCESIISTLEKWDPPSDALQIEKEEIISAVKGRTLTKEALENIPAKLSQISLDHLASAKLELSSGKPPSDAVQRILTASDSKISRENPVPTKQVRLAAFEKVTINVELSTLEKAISTTNKTEKLAENYSQLKESLDGFFKHINSAQFKDTNSSGLKKMREIANDEKRSPLEKLSEIISIAEKKESGPVAWLSRTAGLGKKGRAEEVDTLYKNIADAGKADGIEQLCERLDACSSAPSKAAARTDAPSA